MSIAFWYWLAMLFWTVASIVGFVRGKPAAPPFKEWYWGWGWWLLLFLLFFLIGLKDFPDPFGTLVHR